ncbi:tail fiber domain-containing protein [Marimonas arenosa]|uniref:Tail fiber domain-containing protein n=1 Tax=Marimonas arenosa TaxID=1795305 RepID=A0AAE3WBS2_9RHOB|nr:tail fiber domain-containing protein [Marimonas arenosa]MDQ2088738.1 tail fiber domain-containing protein [Marimonas arenosa]
MAERTRVHLKQEFQDGERPSGSDFADVFDSFLAKQDDGLSVDAVQGTLVINSGLRIGASNDGTAGTLRFNGAALQVHDGANFVDVGTGGGGGAFALLPTGDAAFTGGGNVGIGTSFAGNPPTFGFEVDLGANTGTTRQARFGEAVIHQGTGAQTPAAHFSHRSRASNTDFAIRQRPTGEVNFNTPTNVAMFFTQGGVSTNTRLAITSAGSVLVGTTQPLPGATASHVFQVSGRAGKSQGGTSWDSLSDARLKEDVRDYTTGLEAVRQVRPVRFRWNGQAGTARGEPGIGVIAQEMETVIPETVSRMPANGEGAAHEVPDMRIYNADALIYALVNAVKELAERVEALETGDTETRTVPQAPAAG